MNLYRIAMFTPFLPPKNMGNTPFVHLLLYQCFMTFFMQVLNFHCWASNWPLPYKKTIALLYTYSYEAFLIYISFSVIYLRLSK